MSNNKGSRVGVGMKLNAAQVEEAVNMRDVCGLSWSAIGSHFDVAPSAARKTVEGWRHTIKRVTK